MKRDEEEPKERFDRIAYEVYVPLALRERLRSKAIWIEGANRCRSPDEDLPGAFDQGRYTYHAALSFPQRQRPSSQASSARCRRHSPAYDGLA
jgi:hypothetical protein